MNGRKAKRIRRAVYGDQSIRQKREYVQRVHGWGPVPGIMVGRDGRDARGMIRTISNKPRSLRAVYQQAKKVLA